MKLPNQKDLEIAFEAIGKHDLKPNWICCTVCGCSVNLKKKKKQEVCEHLKELAKACKGDI